MVATAHPALAAARLLVALLCPEARLRRVLRLALEADGYAAVEWSAASAPPLAAAVAAIVVDLDALRCRPPAVIATLSAWGLAETAGLLFISVYPLESERLERPGPLDYL